MSWRDDWGLWLAIVASGLLSLAVAAAIQSAILLAVGAGVLVFAAVHMINGYTPAPKPTCPRCGRPVGADWLACGPCGYSLVAQPPAPPPASPILPPWPQAPERLHADAAPPIQTLKRPPGMPPPDPAPPQPEPAAPSVPQRFCTRCGCEAKAEQKFCGDCGHRLRSQPPAAGPQSGAPGP